MKDIKFHILVVTYNRPRLLRNTLQSIKDQSYDRWHVTVIDDGSTCKESIPDIVSEYFGSLKHTMVEILDTPEMKIAQGGSRHGEAMNNAILEIPSDVVVVVCDDDALTKDYLQNLNDWFQAHPKELWCYSHVIPYNPLVEASIQPPMSEYWTNITFDCHPAGRVDSSQVVYKTECFTKHGARYPSPQTKNLDESIFKTLFNICGLCKFTGFYGQWKGVFEGQMGNRDQKEQYFNTYDKP